MYALFRFVVHKKSPHRNERYLSAFGNHIRTIRKEKNISQGKLSILAEIPLSQVGRIERGEVNTTISTLFTIAKSLEIEPRELLNFTFVDLGA